MKQVICIKPSCFAPEFEMNVSVPANRDSEEYIDELLDGILNEDFRYNAEWDFLGESNMDHKQELSYIELLSKLYDDVEKDMIPAVEKARVIEVIKLLEKLLWKYSY